MLVKEGKWANRSIKQQNMLNDTVLLLKNGHYYYKQVLNALLRKILQPYVHIMNEKLVHRPPLVFKNESDHSFALDY